MSISMQVRPWVAQVLLVAVILCNVMFGLYLVHLWQTKPIIVDNSREHCIYAFPVDHVFLIDAPRALCSGEEEQLRIKIEAEEHILNGERFGKNTLLFFVPLKLGWSTCFQLDIPEDSGWVVTISPFDPSGVLNIWRGMIFFAWLLSLFVGVALMRAKQRQDFAR
jgi:hypothetical protein